MVMETGRLNAAISSVAPADVVMSPDGMRLYVAGTDGKVRVYDMASRSLITTWDVGVSLGGMDVSPDGSFLIVTERNEVSSNGQSSWDRVATVTTYKLDLATGSVTSFPLQVSAFDGPFYDVAIMAGGSILLTATMVGATGMSPLAWTLDPALGTYSRLNLYIQEDTMLWASPSGSHALIAPQNMSNGPLHLYEPGSGLTQQADLYENGYHQTVLSVQAISAEAQLVVQSSGKLIVRGLDLDLDLVLSDLHPQFRNYQITGLAFDGAGANLYILDQISDTITQVSTVDWSIVRTFAVGREVANPAEAFPDGDYGNQLLVSPDGRYFTVVTGTGIQMIENDSLDNSFTGTPGNDVLAGGAGNDLLRGSDGDDDLDGGTGNDTLYGDEGNDVIRGGAGNGNDLIDGGGGDDGMTGGAGNDTYEVGSAGDVVTELAGEGTDLVRTALATYTLAANVEDLTATSDSAHDFRGNAGNNVLTGGAGNDILQVQDGGDDTAIGGAGNDGILFGAALSAGDTVDGGEGNRDQLGLQGNYGTFGAGATPFALGANHLVNIEVLILLSGADTRFGDTAGNAYGYNIATLDTHVPAGQQLTVSFNALRLGENVTFNGSAETNGSFMTYGGLGIDILTGGQQSDAFYFGADGRFGSGDRVDGQSGALDQLGLQGDYSGARAVSFGANSMTNIEMIVLLSAGDNRFGGGSGDGFSYDIVMHDANVAAGTRMFISANTLRADGTLTEALNFNGSAETNGFFTVYAGAGADTLVGGERADEIWGRGGADRITGGLGADVLRGGEGNDVFDYYSGAESGAAGRDSILDFETGDKIDLSSIDANLLAGGDQAFTWIGSNAFTGNGTAGQLRAWQDNATGAWIVEGDMTGDGVADLVIAVTTPNADTILASDFML